MKILSKITLFVCTFMLAVSLQPTVAQSNTNMERMKRDINIMENILHELFKPENSFHSASFSLGDDGIRGTYLPGYGIIFMIPDRSGSFVVFSSDEDGETNPGYRFKYSTGLESDKVTEESVINRISQFLRDYASTIGQLSGNNKVTVIYNSQSSHRAFTIVTSEGEEIENQELPTISVTAQVSALQAFRSGDLSEEAFNEQLQISKTSADDEGPVDVKVMANIFETAFEDAEKSFQVDGSANYLLLDTFGALFSFDASYSETSHWNFGDIRVNVERIKIELEEAREELEHVFSHEEDSEEVQSNEGSDESDEASNYEEQQARHKKDVLKAYAQFKQRLKQYLVDYGRTLRSVGENQQILVTINLHSSVDEIPERIDLRLQKSVLKKMGRDEAINEIQVREY